MNKSLEKIKKLLERKIDLTKNIKYDDLHHSYSISEYHEYICSLKELKSIILQLIDEKKIEPDYLQQIFNDFMVFDYIKNRNSINIKNSKYPNFYNSEIEKEYKLMKGFTKLLKDEIIFCKENPNQKLINPNAILNPIQKDKNIYYLQNLHNNIIEKIEELDGEYYEKSKSGERTENSLEEQIIPANIKEIFLVKEEGIGYLKFYKQGPKIKIASIRTRQFRLIEALSCPTGTAKNIETVFKSISLPKDEKNSSLNGYGSDSAKLNIIKNTMKEIQKIKGLQGKIKLIFTNNSKAVLLCVY